MKTIKEGFENYMNLSFKPENLANMDPVQIKERERAFYAGAATLLVMTLNLPDEEGEAFDIMTKVDDELGKYWENERIGK